MGTETAPDRMPLAANVLDTLGRPSVSAISYGSWSSERLSGLEELCAWSGGLSLNLQDPVGLPQAIKSLVQALMGPERARFLAERRDFYQQKENVGCTKWHLSRAEIIHDKDNMDSTTPSCNMLEVLSDTDFTPKRRWARSLRWWRINRGLRDCVFVDPGTLGIEMDLDEEGYWVVNGTHPPASALNLKLGSTLEAINRYLVRPRTARSELSKRLAERPVSLAFHNPMVEVITRVEDVISEVVVGEFRERMPILKTTEPPLSLASAKQVYRPGKVERLRLKEKARIEENQIGRVAAIDTASLFNILCCLGSVELLQNCASTCKTWQAALRLPRGREPKTPGQSLWSFLIRNGQPVKRRELFWQFLCESDRTELGTSFDAHILVLGAGQLLGLSAAEKALKLLDEVLGFSARPNFEQGRATVIWGMGAQALVDLCSVARAFQVVLAAAYLPFFRSLSADGMAPELFFLKWLMTLCTDILHPDICARLWETFFIEKSFKCVLQACVYIFGQCQDQLKHCREMEDSMAVIYKMRHPETDPAKFFHNASRVKVTRSLLKQIREAELQSSRS